MTRSVDTRIIGGSVGDVEKAGWKADSVQSVENRKFTAVKKKSNNLFMKVSVRCKLNIKCR